MNFAEAIRQASTTKHETHASKDPTPQVYPHVTQQEEPTPELEVVTSKADAAVDAVTAQPVSIPEAPVVTTGSVVRLELFLNPEQLTNLFRAVSATQHSMMTLREAASYLRVHATVLEQMAQDGEIPAFNIDGRWRFPKSGVDEWLTLQAFRKESA
ncbi:MAG TPA: helix-turn-helix domain-containing protein [Fimbriimonadaceae bacterium]|nr:helix-turn-helix domain-containing protein [Fimbriimonadaceae bacterium]